MNQGIELEREYTFLAAKLPDEIANATPTRLVDIYIPESPDIHSHLRLRRKNDDYVITKKAPVQEGDASTQLETTIKLDLNEYTALSTVSNKRVVKDRYAVVINGFPAEVDVFLEGLQGLVLIDFEFADDDERARFIAPDVCLADVTQEHFTAGGLLAGRQYADIAEDLKRFSYQAL